MFYRSQRVGQGIPSCICCQSRWANSEISELIYSDKCLYLTSIRRQVRWVLHPLRYLTCGVQLSRKNNKLCECISIDRDTYVIDQCPELTVSIQTAILRTPAPCDLPRQYTVARVFSYTHSLKPSWWSFFEIWRSCVGLCSIPTIRHSDTSSYILSLRRKATEFCFSKQFRDSYQLVS